MKLKDSKDVINVGHFSGNLTIDSQQQLILTYAGGAKCSGNKNFSTVIIFHCSPSLQPEEENSKMFVEPSGGGPLSECTILVHFFTSLACPYTVSCKVSNTDFDLSPLMNYDGDYEVTSSTKRKDYLNVCKPLAKTGGAGGYGICPSNSAACFGSTDGYFPRLNGEHANLVNHEMNNFLYLKSCF